MSVRPSRLKSPQHTLLGFASTEPRVESTCCVYTRRPEEGDTEGDTDGDAVTEAVREMVGLMVGVADGDDP